MHATVNENLVVQYAVQIKNGIKNNANTSVKYTARAKGIVFGILANVFVRITGI